MIIRRAKRGDADGINELLRQVLMVHHNGRPDLFKANAKKYTDNELFNIIDNDNSPIFVATDETKDGIIGQLEKGTEKVLGYCFCMFIHHPDDNILTDIKTLYIDDLCVDEKTRGQHIGRALYDYVVDYAKAEGCYNVTLNVWSLNKSAQKFYESCGLVPQKVGMEKIL